MLETRKLSKTYGSVMALRELDLTVRDGEMRSVEHDDARGHLWVEMAQH